MVVPALRLDLGVLAQQVEAQLPHGVQFVLHGGVGGRGVKAVGPIALVQQAVEQDGPAVQEKPPDALCILFTLPLAEGEIAVDGVEALFFALCRADRQIIEEGAVGAPREEMLFGDVQSHFAVPVGLVAAPVLGDGHAAGPHHGPEVHRAAGL